MSQNSGSNQLFERVHDLAAPLAASLGLQIWGLELGGGARPLLRIFVELAPGAEPEVNPDLHEDLSADMPEDLLPQSVDVNSLAELSRLLGLGMEVEDLFSDAWTLEVSSPGLERPFFRLEQLSAYLGRQIEVNLHEPVAADPIRKKYSGLVLAVGTGLDKDSFDLQLIMPGSELDGTNLNIPWRLVKKARLVHIFDDPQKPGQTAKPKTKDKR